MNKRKFLYFSVIFLFTVFISYTSAYGKEKSVKGIDVSSHNGVVDWDKVSDSGYSFVMIRTGLGMEQEDDFYADVDAQFEANYEGAKRVGLKVGVYHDCGAKTPERAVKEAEYCLSILDGRKLDYPVAYDMEKAGTFEGGKENTTEIAKAFCDVIKKAGYTPMIYSSASYLENEFDFSKLKGVKIWVAHYDVKKPAFSGTYDIWQYTKSADVDGANTNNGKGKCDENYSFMDALSLKLEKRSITIGVSETYMAKVSMMPENCTDTVAWKSMDKEIATVTKTGKIKALKTGKTTITVVSGSGEEDAMTVIVKKAPKSIKNKVPKKTIKKGEVFRLKPILTSGSASNQLTYTSSNSKIVTVNKNGLVKGKKQGKATVTIKTYNGKKAYVTIIVK